MQFAFVIGIVIFLVVLNIGATYRIFRDDCLNAFQRKGLTIFVWIVPIVGAMFIYYFRGEDVDPEYKDDGLSGYEVADPELPSVHHDSSVEQGPD